MDVTFEGLSEFNTALTGSADWLMKGLIVKANKHAEELARRVRDKTRVADTDGGRTRESIQGFVKANGDELEGGVHSTYENAWYEEFGTGPVASAAGYLGDVSVDHVTEGWWWPSGETGRDIKAQRHGGDPQDYNMMTYTEGKKPEAMFWNSMQEYGDKIAEDFGETVLEVLYET